MKKIEELNIQNKKIIIFDMDGTLIDSIGVWNQTDQAIIKEYGNRLVDLETIQADRDAFLHNNQDKDIYLAYSEYLINKYNLAVKDVKELTTIRKDKPAEIFENQVDFKPGVVELINKLKDLGCSIALATVSTSSQIEIYYKKNKKMLSKMNIAESFDLIITKDDVKSKKPDPEIYNKIRAYFNVLPEECLIFEDSYTGVLAAKNAGIEVVNVYDKYADIDREKINEITDYRIDNYEEFNNFIATIFHKKQGEY